MKALIYDICSVLCCINSIIKLLKSDEWGVVWLATAVLFGILSSLEDK